MSTRPDVTERDRTFFVEAGAGAGKTTALVERVVALVQGGVPVTSIAAITFTEAAAAELRQRVRAALEHAGEAGALDELDDAPLLTIHAFAHRVLGAHAVAAGLPPVVEVRDEVEAAIAFDREWAALVDRLLSETAHVSTLGAAMVLGLDERHLRALARAFHDHWDELVDAPFCDVALSDAPAVAVDAAPLLARLDALDGAIEGCLDPSDRLCRHLRETVMPLAARLRGAGDPLAVLSVAAGAGDLRAGNRGQAPKWRRPTKAAVVQLLDAAEQERRALLRDVRFRLLDLVAEEVRRFTLARVERRKAEGVLEFHDLLVLAREVLRHDARVLAEVRQSITHLLIDEFQDTDPLQAELAMLLGGDADDAGRLFFVGDPKQSIYRFRRADLGVYAALRRAFAADVVPLATNFRSTTGVVRWVSRVFERLFAAGGEGQVRWSKLVAVRPGRSDAGPPVVTFGGAARPDETVAAIREREAADVVEIVRRAVGDPWLVDDVDSGGWRPARLDDIAVLLPTRTALPAIESALDAAGIPSRIESRSLVWATQEARDLLALLRAVDDPSDQVAVVAALRTPALACSDRDLLDAVAAGLRWDQVADVASVAAVLPAGSPVRNGIEVLAAYRAAQRDTAFTALIERVVRELRLLELGMAGPRPREAWSRVRFVVDQARAFADRGRGASLRAFVDWAERQADEKARALETVVPEADHVAVRITTIHAAKGREFPIVVVAGLSVEGEPYRDAAVVWPAAGTAGRPALRLGRADLGWASPGWDEAKVRDTALERQEDDRLTYVACTRARDHLCVSLHHRPVGGTRTSIAARLHAAAVDAGALVELATVPMVLPLGVDAAPSLVVPPPLPSPAGAPSLPVPSHAGAPSLSMSSHAPAMPPSTSAVEPSRSEPSRSVEPSTSAAPSTSVPPSTSAVEPPRSVAPSTSVAPPAPAVPPPAPLRRSGLVPSSAVAQDAKSARWWRDVPVVTAAGEWSLDLLYERDGGLVLAGFGVDDGEPGLVERWCDHLRAQASALGSLVPERPVTQTVLVLVAPDGELLRELTVGTTPTTTG